MPAEDLRFATDVPLSPAQFTDLLRRSTLAARRPVDDAECVAGMVANADLTVTAWRGDRLVGVARSVTDFTYCCYLSDLAVDEACKGEGIGRELIARTRDALGPGCTLILLAAPAAAGYYPKIGFDAHPSAWVLRPEQALI